VCFAECKYVTEQPVCTCEFPGFTPSCRVECPPNQCEASACPQCQVLCEPSAACGQIQCEALTATWACRKPSNCAAPQCELNCEQPACRYMGTEDPWKESYPWALISIVGALLAFQLYQQIAK